jgi:hypothetical protein
MKQVPEAAQRRKSASRDVVRRTFGSIQYLLVLLSMFPPIFAFSRTGGELLRGLQVPVGLILYIPVVVLAIRLRKHQKETIRTRLLQEAVCPKCFYDLTGNVSPVCPECGTAFRWEDVRPKTEVQSPKFES